MTDSTLSQQLYDSAWNYFDSGEYQQSIDMCNVFIQFNSKDSLDERIVKIYNLVGVMNRRLGNFEEAIKNFELAIAYSFSDFLKADININIASVHKDKGDYTKSIDYYNNALSFTRFTNDLSFKFDVYNNLALSLLRANNLDESLKYVLESIKIGEDNKLRNLCYSYITCALVYRELQNYDRSDEFFRKSIRSFDTSYGNEHYVTALGLINYAEFLTETAKFRESDKMLQRAHAILLRYFGPKHPYVSDCLRALGNNALAQGDNVTALTCFQQALIARVRDFNDTSIGNNPSFHVTADPKLIGILRLKALSLENLALTGNTISNLKASLSALQLGAVYIEKLRSGYLSESSKLQLASNEDDLYGRGIRVAAKLHALTDNKNNLYTAFKFAELGKYGVLRQVQNDESARKHAGIPAYLSEQERKILDKMNGFRVLIDEESRKEKPDTVIVNETYRKLFDLTREQEILVKELENNYPEYYRMKYDNSPVMPDAVQKCLKPGQALVEYAIYDNLLYIFLVRKDTLALLVRDADPEFHKQLNAYRSILHSEFMAEYSIYKNSASYLYQALIPEPLLSGISELIIIPDAAFSSISFDALLTGPYQENVMNLYRTEPYLLRKYALGYSFSSTFLVRSLNKDFPLRKSFIGFAPDYSNSRDSLVNIPEGITHVKKLAGMFFGKAIRGTDATENRFKNSGGYNMINFYTHGIDDTLNAARSKMYFCQEGDTLDDGYLYSYEISSMQLHTNLVTLVTCYSGAGELLKGEGVMSIGRSFANAGSPAMVISLWMASAVSSHQIMKEFYRELLRGKTKSVALQSAKLKYIEKTSPMGANPKIWSGLVLYGNQEALFRNFILKVYVVPAIVVLGLGLLFILVYRRMRKDRSLKRRNYNQD